MKKTADILIVIDMQVAVYQNLWQKEALLAQINQRIADYRKADKPILFIRHHDEELIAGSADWQLWPALDYQAGDRIVEKAHANGFYQTDLQRHLSELGVTSLEFCGAETPFCVNSTLVFAHGLGYRCQMQHGASSTSSLSPWMSQEVAIDYYENQIWDQRFLDFVD